MSRNGEPFWLHSLEYQKVDWQIIVVGKTSVLLSFYVFNWPRTIKMASGPILTFIQLSDRNTCTDPWFNYNVFGHSITQPDTPLRTVQLPFGFIFWFLPPSIGHSLWPFFFIIFIFVFGLFLNICCCVLLLSVFVFAKRRHNQGCYLLLAFFEDISS